MSSIDGILGSFDLLSTDTVQARIYILLNDNLSGAQGKSVTDTIAQAGYRLAVLAAPRILIIDADTKAPDAFSALMGTTIAAIGIDDVTPLLDAATASPALTAQLTALKATTPAAEDAAEAARSHKGEGWPRCVAEEQ